MVKQHVLTEDEYNDLCNAANPSGRVKELEHILDNYESIFYMLKNSKEYKKIVKSKPEWNILKDIIYDKNATVDRAKMVK